MWNYLLVTIVFVAAPRLVVLEDDVFQAVLDLYTPFVLGFSIAFLGTVSLHVMVVDVVVVLSVERGVVEMPLRI